MIRTLSICLIVVAALAGPAKCHAGVIYNYYGQPFTEIGYGGVFNPGDSV